MLRLLHGESADALSRELAAPTYRLEECRDRALAGMDVGLKERENDPLEKQFDDANRRIGELVKEQAIHGHVFLNLDDPPKGRMNCKSVSNQWRAVQRRGLPCGVAGRPPFAPNAFTPAAGQAGL